MKGLDKEKQINQKRCNWGKETPKKNSAKKRNVNKKVNKKRRGIKIRQTVAQ